MFRLIIAQTGTYMSKTVQITSVHLTSLYDNNDLIIKNNNFIIKNTQDFAQLIREQHLLEENDKLPHICSKFFLRYCYWI